MLPFGIVTGRPPARRREGRGSGLLLALDLTLTFLRVLIVVGVSLTLFLAAFFGYLTAPFVVLVVFVGAYAVVDRYRVRQRHALERRRRILDEPVPEPIYYDPAKPGGAKR